MNKEKDIPYVLITRDFEKYAKDARKQKKVKVLLFNLKEHTVHGNYKEDLAMLMVLQIPYVDEFGESKIREIPQSSKSDCENSMRIHKEKNKIAEYFEDLAANRVDFEIKYCFERDNIADKYPIEVNNYLKIFRDNIAQHKFEKELKEISKVDKLNRNAVVDNNQLEDFDFLNTVSSSLNNQKRENIIQFKTN